MTTESFNFNTVSEVFTLINDPNQHLYRLDRGMVEHQYPPVDTDTPLIKFFAHAEAIPCHPSTLRIAPEFTLEPLELSAEVLNLLIQRFPEFHFRAAFMVIYEGDDLLTGWDLDLTSKNPLYKNLTIEVYPTEEIIITTLDTGVTEETYGNQASCNTNDVIRYDYKPKRQDKAHIEKMLIEAHHAAREIYPIVTELFQIQLQKFKEEQS